MTSEGIANILIGQVMEVAMNTGIVCYIYDGRNDEYGLELKEILRIIYKMTRIYRVINISKT